MESRKPKHHVQQSEVILYPACKMYSLVADVERYPEFLPWCKGSRIKKEDGHEVIAELTVGFGVIEAAFTTRNRYRPGKKIRMDLVEGPFEQLEGIWQCRSINRQKSRMMLDSHFQFADRKLEALFDSAFKKAMEQLLKAFKARAKALYGTSGPGGSSPAGV